MVSQVGTKDMTVGNTKKIIINFAIPIFLSQLFQQLYNMADTLIVGKYLGTEALAAVSSSGPLIFLLVSFFNGASMGAGVIISRDYYTSSHSCPIKKTNQQKNKWTRRANCCQSFCS